MKTRIGYDNLLEKGVVAASSQDAANPVENCFDWNTADWFKSAAGGTINLELTLATAGAADYLAFYGHNLPSVAGTIKLQYDLGAGYVDATATITPTDTKPVMVFFGSQSATNWRVVITASAAITLGVLSFGTALVLPRGMYLGWTPPRLARATRLVNSVSEGGAFLGRSRISTGVMTSLNLNNAPDAWVDANWPAFVLHAESKSFFFVPDALGHPADVALCWVDGEQMPPPSHVHFGYMGASIPIAGVIE
ncbi:hypothetical protein [Tardiphaga sp.]|jgi:hypothetical protein|uniref:hypothetical protein n=1 Tax=Tardiphaga sp. TaxID=1926292 RepID=UPI0037DA398B